MKQAKYISCDMLEVPASERPVYKPGIYMHNATGRKILSQGSYTKLLIQMTR
jgi:hypothetical protein